jgi:hypothetical protein
MREIRRARKILQQAALTEFPNPERIGCPPAGALEAVAQGKRPASEEDLHHITHCSPCFDIFLGIRQNVRKQRLHRAALALASSVILIAGIYLAARFGTRNHTTVIAQWDLEFASPVRGAEVQRQVLVQAPHMRGTVLIRLPFGSDDGQYEVAIVKDIGGPPIRNFHGRASIQNGYTKLSIRMDFSGLQAGKYYVAYRHGDASWRFVQLAIH